VRRASGEVPAAERWGTGPGRAQDQGLTPGLAAAAPADRRTAQAPTAPARGAHPRRDGLGQQRHGLHHDNRPVRRTPRPLAALDRVPGGRRRPTRPAARRAPHCRDLPPRPRRRPTRRHEHVRLDLDDDDRALPAPRPRARRGSEPADEPTAVGATASDRGRDRSGCCPQPQKIAVGSRSI